MFRVTEQLQHNLGSLADEDVDEPKHNSEDEARTLPSGWQEIQDPNSGNAYYYNANTGESRWERPS